MTVFIVRSHDWEKGIGRKLYLDSKETLITCSVRTTLRDIDDVNIVRSCHFGRSLFQERPRSSNLLAGSGTQQLSCN